MPFWDIVRGVAKKADDALTHPLSEPPGTTQARPSLGPGFEDSPRVYRGSVNPRQAETGDPATLERDAWWGTDDPRVAGQYAGDWGPKPIAEGGWAPQQLGAIVPARVNFKKPLVIDGMGARWGNIRLDKGNMAAGHNTNIFNKIEGRHSTESIVEAARDAGYDGVIFRNIVDPPLDSAPGIPSDVYVGIGKGTVKSDTTGEILYSMPSLSAGIGGAMAAAGMTFGGADDAEAAGWRVMKAAANKGSSAPTMKMGDWGLSDNVHPNPTPTGNAQIEAMGIKNQFRYVIHKGDKEVGVVEGVVTQKPGTEPQAYIAWVGPSTRAQGEKIEGFLHPGVIKGFRERFRQDFPEVKNFGGFRIGGSMEGQAVSRMMPALGPAAAGGVAGASLLGSDEADASTFSRAARGLSVKAASRGDNKNLLTWNNESVWGVVVDNKSGKIIHGVPYEHAADNDFHHNMYMPSTIAKKVSKGDAHLVWGDSRGLHSMTPLPEDIQHMVVKDLKIPISGGIAATAAASGVIPAEPAQAAPTHEQGSQALANAAMLPADLASQAATGMPAGEAWDTATGLLEGGVQMADSLIRGQGAPQGASPVEDIPPPQGASSVIAPPQGADPVGQPPQGADKSPHEPPSGFWNRIGSRISGTDVDDPQMYPRTSAMIAGGVGGGMGLASKTPGPPHIKAAAGAIGGATGVVAGALFPEATMEFLEASGLVPEGTRDRYGLSDAELKTVAEGELLLDLATGGGVAAIRGLSRGVSNLLTGPTAKSRQLAEDAAAEGINLMPIMVGERPTARMYVNVAGRFPLIAGPLRRHGKEAVERLHEAYNRLPERIAPVAAQSDTHMKVLTEMGDLVERINGRFVQQFDELLSRPDVAVTPQRTASAIQDMVDDVGDLIPTPGPVTQGRPQQVRLPGRVSELQGFLNKTLLPIAREGTAADQTLKQMDNLLGAVDREIAKFAGRGDTEAVNILNRVRTGIQHDMVGNLRGPGAAEAAADLQRLTGEWSHAVDELVANGIARRMGITPAEGFRAMRFTGNRDNIASTIGVVMRSQDAGMVDDLARVLDRSTFQELSSKVLEDRVGDAFRRTPDGSMQFDPSRFSKSLGLDAPGSELYKQTEAFLRNSGSGLTMKHLTDLNEYSRAIASAPIPDVSTFIARRGTIGGLRSIITSAIPTMAAGGAAGGASGAIGGLMLVLGARGISHAIANPANARLLRKVIDQDVKKAVRWGAYERLGRLAIQGLEDAYEMTPDAADMYRSALGMFRDEFQKYEARYGNQASGSEAP